MPSPKLSVRVSDQTYTTLLKLAQVEKKSLTELVRELLERGLEDRKSANVPDSPEVMARLQELERTIIGALSQQSKTGIDQEAEKRLTELVLRSIRVASAAQFYARQAAIPAQDVASIWGEQINAMESTDSRKEAIDRMDTDSQKFAEWWVKNG